MYDRTSLEAGPQELKFVAETACLSPASNAKASVTGLQDLHVIAVWQHVNGKHLSVLKRRSSRRGVQHPTSRRESRPFRKDNDTSSHAPALYNENKTPSHQQNKKVFSQTLQIHKMHTRTPHIEHSQVRETRKKGGNGGLRLSYTGAPEYHVRTPECLPHSHDVPVEFPSAMLESHASGDLWSLVAIPRNPMPNVAGEAQSLFPYHSP